MIGRKNKGPSLAIATSALGGTGDVLSLITAPLGFSAGYLSGSFETLGGIIPALLTAIVGSLGTSAASLLPSLASLGSFPLNSFLDSFSSSGVTSLPSTPISNFGLIFPSLSTSLIPFI